MTMQVAEQAPSFDWRLWGRWIGANVLGEFIGLGVAGLVGAGIGLIVRASAGQMAPLVMMAVLVALGTFEGTVVGAMQWRVLRGRLSNLRLRAWLIPTIAGAFAAWVLGMLPSTLMDLGAGPSAAPPADIPDWISYVMAIPLGLVAGAILGGPQFFALRRHIRRAGWWVLANALAWMVGMPLVFVGASHAPPGGRITVGYAAFVLALVIAAGTVVGAVHGAWLVWLMRGRR